MDNGNTQRDERLNDIREMWANENDEWVVKAALEDIEEYAPGVQKIIRTEAIKRRLITETNTKAGEVNGQAAITEKGIEILTTSKVESPGFFMRSALLAYGTMAIVVCGLFIAGYWLGLPERAMTVGGAFIFLSCWAKINDYRKKQIQSHLSTGPKKARQKDA